MYDCLVKGEILVFHQYLHNKNFVLFSAYLLYAVNRLRTKNFSKNNLRVLSLPKHARFSLKWDLLGQKHIIFYGKRHFRFSMSFNPS